MRASEFIESVKRAEEETGHFYASSKAHFRELFYDISDGIEEEYIEVEFATRNRDGNTVTVKCDDGKVVIKWTENGLEYHDVRKEEDEAERAARRAGLTRISRMLSPFERTRAMVYASGNVWQIANFEATH